MSIIVKKITKKTLLSVATIGGLMIAAVFRIFFGGSYLNVSHLNSGKEGSGFLVETAMADSVSEGGSWIGCVNCEGGQGSGDGAGGAGGGGGGGAGAGF